LVSVGKNDGLPAGLPFTGIGEINNPEQMAIAYQAADLFVLPSLAENLPNTIAEALLCGTPAIGFNVGGIPEMIINGKTGFLCDEINATNLAITIDRFFNEINTFSTAEIRNVAVEKYSVKRHAEKYNDLYNKIINRTRA
jgi:glycosyltransferase involved in cell wall biosynthesis